MREKDEEDIRLTLIATGKALFPQTSKEIASKSMTEKSGATDMEKENAVRSERVRLSDEDTVEEFEESQSESIGEKVKAVGGGKT